MLTIAIIAKDEERYIGGCLDSVAGLADEVIVLLDARSSDGTAAICLAKGARLFIEPWRGFGGQRNRALELCQSEWVLFLDADERVTPELREDLAQFVSPRSADERRQQAASSPQSPSPSPQPPSPSPQALISGYWLPRHNLFFGRRLRGGGWYPDHQLRLLRRGAARYDEGRLVHEVAELAGVAGHLQGHILHYNIDRIDEFWRKQTAFARFEADTLRGQGRRARLRNFVGAPARELWRRFVQLGGWRDGPLGLFLCGALAWFEVVKFVRLWGLQHGRRTTDVGR